MECGARGGGWADHRKRVASTQQRVADDLPPSQHEQQQQREPGHGICAKTSALRTRDLASKIGFGGIRGNVAEWLSYLLVH